MGSGFSPAHGLIAVGVVPDIIIERAQIKTGGKITGGAGSKADLSQASGLILVSPNGSRWSILVSDTGQITAVLET